MSYADVQEIVERVLLGMVAEGLARFDAAGPDGPTFDADDAELWARVERAGLLDDDVPWLHPVRAVQQMSPVPPATNCRPPS